MKIDRSPSRGIAIVLGLAFALLCLEGLVIFVAGQILARRFGVAVKWTHPELALPIGVMLVCGVFALEALIRKRGETAMVVNSAATLLVVVGIVIYFVLQIRMLALD